MFNQVRVQERVETIQLFDTGADADVMPKHVWEQLGEPTLQTTKVTLTEASGQDLGAMGEVQVGSFIGKIKVSVHSSGCTRRETVPSEWNATQNKGIHVQVESTREFSHTTKWQPRMFPHSTERRPKSNDVTRKKQRHSQRLCAN